MRSFTVLKIEENSRFVAAGSISDGISFFSSIADKKRKKSKKIHNMILFDQTINLIVHYDFRFLCYPPFSFNQVSAV